LEEKTLGPEESIFKMGECVQTLYYVISGKIEIYLERQDNFYDE
jgi:CRP-like cAMP-binding protein